MPATFASSTIDYAIDPARGLAVQPPVAYEAIGSHDVDAIINNHIGAPTLRADPVTPVARAEQIAIDNTPGLTHIGVVYWSTAQGKWVAS